MTPMVETSKLSKRFGQNVAVEDLDWTVASGEVVGFIGPNGAGKSTTLKMLATILKPDGGTALVGGHSVTKERDRVRRLIGYMPDVSGLYEEMMVHEYLRFFASVYGLRAAAAEKVVDEMLALTGLEGKVNEKCRALSRGMSQRLHLARALLHDPKLLLLDEPASGLDPRARIEFKELVLALKKMGKTLIISSHILSELGEMCDSIAIIEQSRLVYSGPVGHASDQVRAEGKVFLLRTRDEPENGRSHGDLTETVRGFEYIDAVREGEGDGRLFVRFRNGFTDYFQLNEELVRRGFKIEQFTEDVVRLEEAFLHLTKGKVS